MPSLSRTALISLLPVLTSAHFHLHFPAARSDDDTNQPTWPCGGHDVVSAERTPVSLTSLPLSMELGHTTNFISVILALGNEGNNFTYELWPTVDEEGPGDWCWAGIPIPAELGIEEGTNATVQVITDGHATGGLYNCADITFTASSPAEPETCTNGTGITAEFLNADTLANTTAAHEEGEGHSGHGDNATETGDAAASSSSSASATGSGATSSPSPTAGSSGANSVAVMAAGWVVLGASVLGAVALL